MAEVRLFHHVLGRTTGVVGFADSLRRAGHTVHVPDLFEGLTFRTIDEGVAHVEAVGFDALVERAVATSDPSERVVYLGWSFGVVPAQRLAQTRPGAVAAVLLEACVPLGVFGEPWPTGVPVQVHGMADDAFFAGEGDLAAANTLVASTAAAELFVYPGSGHLFADPGGPAFDAAATAAMTNRVLGLLASVDDGPGGGAPVGGGHAG